MKAKTQKPIHSEIKVALYCYLYRGQVEVLDEVDGRIKTLEGGDYFNELCLLYAPPRIVSIRASAPCDLFVLS